MSFQESSESIKSRFYLQKNKKALVMGSAVLLVLIALLGAFSFIASSQQGEFSIQKADNEQTAQASEHQENQAEQTKQTEENEVVIHIAGAVHNPDLYTLPAQSRVEDAIKAAGGLLKDAYTQEINRARKLEDGEQIYIPTEKELREQAKETAPKQAETNNSSSTKPSTSKSSPANSEGKQQVNINTATKSELESLPGIGPAMAERIIEDRTTQGSFNKKEDLKRIRGIGEKKFAKLEKHISV